MPPKKGKKGGGKKGGGKKKGGKKGKKGEEELTPEEQLKKSTMEMQNLKHHLSLQNSLSRSAKFHNNHNSYSVMVKVRQKLSLLPHFMF